MDAFDTRRRTPYAAFLEETKADVALARRRVPSAKTTAAFFEVSLSGSSSTTGRRSRASSARS